MPYMNERFMTDEADEKCAEIGTHVLALETEEENDYFTSLLNQKCKPKYIVAQIYFNCP